MLIDAIYFIITIVSIVIVIAISLKFKVIKEQDDCYMVKSSTHPLHINNKWFMTYKD